MIDCHTHTFYSMDSDADIVQMCLRAEKLGLEAYAVTDHCECAWWYPKEHYADTSLSEDYDFASDFENSVSAVCRLKERFDGRLNLICGTELGSAMHDLGVAEKAVSDKRLDFVIGSVHQLRGLPDFAFIDYKKYSENEIYALLSDYFQEIYELCRWGKFDVLGHLTYALRYISGNYGMEADLSRFEEIIAESFRELVRNGCGIEINTSGLRQAYGRTFPELHYIKLFRSVGGQFISIGSDAHTVEDLGKGVGDGAELARAAGFDRVCFFRQRRPEYIKL